jgi:hypothetical protein
LCDGLPYFAIAFFASEERKRERERKAGERENQEEIRGGEQLLRTQWGEKVLHTSGLKELES